jgi:hypothetical protein
MPGLVKVGAAGSADAVEKRRRTLSIRTGVAESYEIEAVYPSYDPFCLEKLLHQHLQNHRVDKPDFQKRKPEFFKINSYYACQEIRRCLLNKNLCYDAKNHTKTMRIRIPSIQHSAFQKWDFVKTHFRSRLKTKIEEISPKHWQLSRVDRSYFNLENEIARVIDERALHGFVSILSCGKRVYLFVDVYSEYGIVHFVSRILIGEVLRDARYVLIPIKLQNDKHILLHKNYMTVVTLICESVQQQEWDIISAIAGTQFWPL